MCLQDLDFDRKQRKVVQGKGKKDRYIPLSEHFYYKDYKVGGIKKTMLLQHSEFVLRFALRILPKRFVKIRHYGLLRSIWKRKKLKQLQESIHVKLPAEKSNKNFKACNYCKAECLVTIELFDKRGPPSEYLGASQILVPCKN